jgi:hypothetical protein
MRVNLKKVKLVEPRQGFNSLDKRLWKAYSVARNRGYTDLGTYANKPGDHGYWPARAFDIGRKDRFYNRGWNYLKARRLAKWYWRNRVALNIDYVILGDKIISRKYPYWRPFKRDTSHFWHIHVSMWWADK